MHLVTWCVLGFSSAPQYDDGLPLHKRTFACFEYETAFSGDQVRQGRSTCESSTAIEEIEDIETLQRPLSTSFGLRSTSLITSPTVPPTPFFLVASF